MAFDNKQDVAFDILANLVEFTFNRNLPRTSLKIEAALDTFLEETGRATAKTDVENGRPPKRGGDVPWSRAGRSAEM